MATYAFIPARGNSKRVPGKNFKPINGHPLVYYTIKAAIESKIDQIVFTTEDSRLSQMANDIAFKLDSTGAKFNVVNRHPKLSQDIVQVDEVVLDAFRTIQESPNWAKPDTVIVLQPTSPLRNATDINNALDQWGASNKEGCLISGYEIDGFLWQGGTTTTQVNPIGHEPPFRLGKQWIKNPPRHYVENGAIYITSAETFSLRKVMRFPPYQMFIMPRIKSVDVDTTRDFNRAAELISHLNQLKQSKGK